MSIVLGEAPPQRRRIAPTESHVARTPGETQYGMELELMHTVRWGWTGSPEARGVGMEIDVRFQTCTIKDLLLNQAFGVVPPPWLYS